MNLEEKKEVKSWYDKPRFVVNIVTLLLFGILVYSQSISSSSNLTGWELFRNIMNVNLLYVIILIYFVIIRFRVGKRYFNYCNVLLILLYFFVTMTSFLSIISSFDLLLFLVLLINLTLFIQMSHTFLRGTVSWKEFGMERSPFNEIKAGNYFVIVFVLSTLYLVINLISTGEFSGVVLTLFVSLYYIFFSRYIYLYSLYLDSIDKDKDNSGNFGEVKEKMVDSVNKVINEEKIDSFVDTTRDKIDEMIDDVSEKLEDLSGSQEAEPEEFILKETEIEVVKKKKKKKKKKKPTTENVGGDE